ncbi:XRE family transcriptional regulator [Nocardia sp. NPDC001965]
MGRKPKVTYSEVVALSRQGYNQSEIAEMKGVSRQYISELKFKYGGDYSERDKVLREHFPFEVPVPMTYCSPYQRLRDHGEYFATNGEGMEEYKLQRLRWFYSSLRDKVVEFDPSIPADPGVCNKGGWAYRERLPSDGRLLIRVNEFTNLTDEGKIIWRFPKKEP